jgi:glycosyltransferase involved in cell wall biosynthesis
VALAIKPYPTVVPALWIQRLKGAKVVIDVDDLDYDYSHGWFKALHKAIELPWPRWADLATYHNPHLREPLQRVFHVPAARLVQLEQGVDRDLFHPGPVRDADLPSIARALSKHKPGPLLTFTAHLSVASDLEPLLMAMKTIHAANPKVHLLVAGGGPDEGRFKRLALEMGLSPSVHFTGYLTPRQVAACLKVSDVAVVYYRESHVNLYRASMKLREAVACGCRVVATDVGEASHFRNVLLLSAPNPAAYAKTVLSALRGKKAPQKPSALVKKLDWTRCVGNLEKRSLELCAS